MREIYKETTETIKKGILPDDEIDEIERWATGKPLTKEWSVHAFPFTVLKLLQSHKVLADLLKATVECLNEAHRQNKILREQVERESTHECSHRDMPLL